MSVYTSLSQVQLTQLLGQYELGEMLTYEGIAEGIENTNYRIQTSTGFFVLTIFEQLSTTEIPYFLQLMAFFRRHGLAIPEPIADTNQQVLMSCQSRPAALFHHLPGRSLYYPEIIHCQQIGTALGQLHHLGQQFPLQRANEWGPDWVQQTGRCLLQDFENQHRQGKEHCLESNDAQLLADELLFQKSNHDDKLPQGIIHADLFCDNALFEDNHLSGIVDFYTACHAPLLFDLAVAVNDWCIGDDGYPSIVKSNALIKAHELIRPPLENEKQYWPIMLRAAALRFWLSRLLYRQSHKPAELTQDKNPDVLKCLLQRHREKPPFWH